MNNPPFPQAYGFQQSLVDFQGSGDQVMYIGDGLSQQNADVPGNITWAQWYDGSRLFTDAAIGLIENAVAQGKPFYLHVPYTDVHDAYHVAPGHENDFAHVTDDATANLFLGNLQSMDKQVGRLLDKLDELGIAENTLVVLMGDNGAPNNALNTLLSRNGGLKGGKGSLWEGGIRESYIVRMPGVVPAKVNTTSIVSTLDLLPTFCELAGITVPPAPYDGRACWIFSRVPTGNERGRFFGSSAQFPTSRRIRRSSPCARETISSCAIPRGRSGSFTTCRWIATRRRTW